MKVHFYSHLVELDTILVELETLDLSDAQKAHLVELVEKNMHHTIIDAILSELPEDEKKVFLHHVIYNDHSKTWQHLQEKIENIEEKIMKAAESLKKDLRKDIEETKKP